MQLWLQSEMFLLNSVDMMKNLRTVRYFSLIYDSYFFLKFCNFGYSRVAMGFVSSERHKAEEQKKVTPYRLREACAERKLNQRKL